MAERSSLENFEMKVRTLGTLLDEMNFALGDKKWESEGRMFPPEEVRYTEADRWNPYTDEEADRIRHYYGQKMALEDQGTILGLLIPLWHEIAGAEGIIKSAFKMDAEGIEESIYDLYVNALGAKDHYMDEGLPGEPFLNRMRAGIPDEEFMMFGDKALDRMGYVSGQSLSKY